MDWKTRIIKRTIDVAAASVGLALTAPLFPIVAAAVRATSKGPIFYTQTRCAAERRADIAPTRPPISERRRDRGFRTFEMYKFRTMRVDAEVGRGAVLAQKNDPRLTPIGGFLRKTRLDELPQLVHVLLGDMSLVGPRPERPELLNKIADVIPFFDERMRLIKPGITGLAQVKLGYDGHINPWSRSRADLERLVEQFREIDPEASDQELVVFANKLLYDLAYSAIVENPWECLKTDLKVMAKTPLVMVLGMGR
jgi:lipopolysaccharide/colanic/teichoic acid biosynthesis glycosyltransferase